MEVCEDCGLRNGLHWEGCEVAASIMRALTAAPEMLALPETSNDECTGCGERDGVHWEDCEEFDRMMREAAAEHGTTDEQVTAPPST